MSDSKFLKFDNVYQFMEQLFHHKIGDDFFVRSVIRKFVVNFQYFIAKQELTFP